jgi:hypothetical protein
MAQPERRAGDADVVGVVVVVAGAAAPTK